MRGRFQIMEFTYSHQSTKVRRLFSSFLLINNYLGQNRHSRIGTLKLKIFALILIFTKVGKILKVLLM